MSCITLSSPPKPLSECSLSGCRKRTRLREKRARLYTVTCCTSLCSQPRLVSGPEGLFWGFLGHQMENKQTNKSYMKWDLSIGCGEGHVIPDVYHLSRLSFKGIEEQEEQKPERTAKKLSVGRAWISEFIPFFPLTSTTSGSINNDLLCYGPHCVPPTPKFLCRSPNFYYDRIWR